MVDAYNVGMCVCCVGMPGFCWGIVVRCGCGGVLFVCVVRVQGEVCVMCVFEWGVSGSE